MRFNIISILFTVFALLLLNSCNDNRNNLDAEVHITKFYKTTWQGGSATVNYQVENTGDTDIRGWNIYFRVSMKSGKQVQAFDGLTYDLEVGETSDELLAIGAIPDHFDNVDEPIKATLQLIEVY